MNDSYPGVIHRIVPLTHPPRCSVHPNPKRPTWRCKNTAAWLFLRSDVTGKGGFLCDEHLGSLEEAVA